MSGDRRQQRKRIAKAQAAVERFLEATSRQIDAQAALLTGNPALKEQAEISGEVVAAFDRLVKQVARIRTTSLFELDF